MSIQISFQKLKLRAIFCFTNLICSSLKEVKVLENVSGICHIFEGDEKLQNNIRNRAKKKKDNNRKMPHDKNILGNQKFAET